jgi:hypothetical protein
MLPPKLLFFFCSFFFFRTSSAQHRSSLFLLYTTVAHGLRIALTAAASAIATIHDNIMKFLVRKEARSPYRKGKIIAAQTEDLKPSPRNKRERKHFHKRNPKENKQVRATQISKYQETNSKAHQSTPGHQQNQIATHQFFMKKNKQTNPQRYVYRCSDQQKRRTNIAARTSGASQQNLHSSRLWESTNPPNSPHR